MHNTCFNISSIWIICLVCEAVGALCFTGREIFVGLSSRSNMLGAQSVAKAFPEYPTTIVKVYPPALHLKDYISMAGPEIMTVGKSEGARKTFMVISDELLFNGTFWGIAGAGFLYRPDASPVIQLTLPKH